MRGEHIVAFDRILVPLDGSELAEQAIPYARAAAREEGILIYAQVVPRAESIHGLTGGTVASASEVGTMFEQTATSDLDQAAQRWKEIAPNYKTVIGVGDPSETILKLARENECDLIVIASHGRGALGRWTFGSVADRLSRTSELPVLIIRPRDASVEYGKVPAFSRILLPTDGSELSRSAVDEAAALAKHLGQEVVLVRSIFPEAELAPTAGFEAVYAPEIYEELSRSLEEDARKSLDATAQMVRDEGAEVKILLMHGPAAQTIESVARPDDLIVMSSHGRSGFKRWLIGSVAEKLVRTAPCPVMLVRADDEKAGA
jgi:nucleotide-binding universal stress UspA family protein